MEENVIKPAGANNEATDEVLRGVITDAGFTPRLRNAAYCRLEDAVSPS
jgi:2-iminoacetate synthase ThiH